MIVVLDDVIPDGHGADEAGTAAANGGCRRRVP
jgi:hypothetical protein